MSANNATYPACSHLHRQKPRFDVITKELIKDVGAEFRVMPSYEKGIYDRIYRDHYSMQSNEFLKCRWKSYRQTIDKRIFKPFQFVDNRDFHFYLNQTRLVPSETTHKRPNFRNKLAVGPGVDCMGQMPVPDDLNLKRGEQRKVKIVKLKRGDGVRAMEKRCGKKMEFKLEPKVDVEAIMKKRAAAKKPDFEKAGLD